MELEAAVGTAAKSQNKVLIEAGNETDIKIPVDEDKVSEGDANEGDKAQKSSNDMNFDASGRIL